MTPEMAQALFDNFWGLYGANYEIIGSSRDQLAQMYGALLSSALH